MIRALLIGLFACVFAQDAEEKLRQEYEEKRLQAPQNAKGQFDLGKWCEKKKLKEEAIKAYERALEIDPEFEPARKALGFKKVLGRWANEKNYADTSWWAHPKVDQKKVDDAIVKGMEYLLNQAGRLPEVKHTHGHKLRCDELVLLTAIQSGWDRSDARFKGLVQRVLALPMDKTYHVALKAMCLAEIDPLKYQQYLAQCAQFLVDNQCENGQWTYGKPVPTLPPPGSFPTTDKGPIPNIETGPEGHSTAADPKAPRPKQIEIKKGQSVGEKTGDNSNSQYAALGIRACLSGLVVVPKETIAAAEAWWEKCQKSDGGWGYGAGPNGDSGMPNEPSWGSMSAGAIGGLVIYKYYRSRVWGEKVDWKTASSVTRGCAWLGSNLTYTANPKHPDINAWQYYFYYAVERAGRLLETEQFGSREWYPEGANALIGRQAADGSWPAEDWGGQQGLQGMTKQMKDQLLPGVITETCFAILFLRRATPKLDETIKIKSGDQKFEKK